MVVSIPIIVQNRQNEVVIQKAEYDDSTLIIGKKSSVTGLTNAQFLPK